MTQTRFSHQIVEFVPERLEEGVLYISHRYKTAIHKCACGCGEEIVTPLNPADWSIWIEDGNATLEPSIGNWSLDCQSHYYIREGNVVWASRMSRQQIEFGRSFDRKERERYIKTVNREKEIAFNSVYEVWRAFRRWWKSK